MPTWCAKPAHDGWLEEDWVEQASTVDEKFRSPEKHSASTSGSLWPVSTFNLSNGAPTKLSHVPVASFRTPLYSRWSRENWTEHATKVCKSSVFGTVPQVARREIVRDGVSAQEREISAWVFLALQFLQPHSDRRCEQSPASPASSGKSSL